jgi:hypothetical protein
MHTDGRTERSVLKPDPFYWYAHAALKASSRSSTHTELPCGTRAQLFRLNPLPKRIKYRPDGNHITYGSNFLSKNARTHLTAP